MKLDTNSWHYKLWCSSFSSYDRKPLTTDLCRYCHRVFWQLVLRAFMVVAMGMLAWMLIWGGLYQGLYLHTKVALCVVGGIVLVFGSILLYMRWLHGGRGYRSEPKTLVGKYARASKDRVCPLVQFDEHHDTSSDRDY